MTVRCLEKERWREGGQRERKREKERERERVNIFKFAIQI